MNLWGKPAKGGEDGWWVYLRVRNEKNPVKWYKAEESEVDQGLSCTPLSPLQYSVLTSLSFKEGASWNNIPFQHRSKRAKYQFHPGGLLEPNIEYINYVKSLSKLLSSWTDVHICVKVIGKAG